MDRARRQERLHTAALVAFLAAIVAAGLLGVPAGVVVLGGALVAGSAIFILRGPLGSERAPRPRTATVSRSSGRQFVPSVLGSPARRRRGVRPRRRQHPGRPLR